VDDLGGISGFYDDTADVGCFIAAIFLFIATII